MAVGISAIALLLFFVFILNPAFGILFALLGILGFGLFGWV